MDKKLFDSIFFYSIQFYRPPNPPLKDINNTGKEDLVIIKFFGPEINNDIPAV